MRLPLSLILAGATVGPVAAGYTPVVGSRHADFTLPNIDSGKPVSLADFRGKKVILLHFASW